jgi:hypothetical protein
MSEPMRKTAEELKKLRQERIENQKDLEDLAETKAKILVLQVSCRLRSFTAQHSLPLRCAC